MKHVFVGLSGGVDSAVSAALLQQEGYRVTGCFIKIWQPEFIQCTWKEDRLDAMRVCAALGIPFKEIDLSREYQEEVVVQMLDEYRHGNTPNPDVLCNRSIKFGHFATWAFENGADLIATGHYARIQGHDGSFDLLRAADPAKDQSYFLFRLTQKDLARTLFPIGGLRKSQVRSRALAMALPVAKKHDSQGLCFVGDVSMKDFLQRYISLEEGNVIDERGIEIGRHDGAALYTLGERHGFAASGNEPHFVTAIEVTNNIVHVSKNREDAYTKKVTLREVSWTKEKPDLTTRLVAQARYHETPVNVSLSEEPGKNDSILVATFSEPHLASPGQSLVLYDGQTCIGGALINTIVR